MDTIRKRHTLPVRGQLRKQQMTSGEWFGRKMFVWSWWQQGMQQCKVGRRKTVKNIKFYANIWSCTWRIQVKSVSWQLKISQAYTNIVFRVVEKERTKCASYWPDAEKEAHKYASFLVINTKVHETNKRVVSSLVLREIEVSLLLQKCSELSST